MPEAPRRLAAVITGLSQELAAAGIEQPGVDARLLALDAAGLGRLDLLRDPDRLIDAAAWARLSAYRQRRLAREPVSRILGRREFWSLDLAVTPDVLDPRPETELLVEAALDDLRARKREHEPVTILDLGTGSGAILIALLSELPSAIGVGVDVSPRAIDIARRNAQTHAVDARAHFVVGHWAEAIGGPVDMIVSNPPYLRTAEIGRAALEVRAYDPMLALDGGPDGLVAYRSIVAAWQRLNHPPMLLEAGAKQAEDLIDLIEENRGPSGDLRVVVRDDLAGLPRIVIVAPHTAFPR
jgi:release factor glutamine methyltransferase